MQMQTPQDMGYGLYIEYELSTGAPKAKAPSAKRKLWWLILSPSSGEGEENGMRALLN
jgi:hypothetical protein